jgi:hypothetical protein
MRALLPLPYRAIGSKHESRVLTNTFARELDITRSFRMLVPFASPRIAVDDLTYIVKIIIARKN